jgi:GNAT superfamily N-acetyltransferase
VVKDRIFRVMQEHSSRFPVDGITIASRTSLASRLSRRSAVPTWPGEQIVARTQRHMVLRRCQAEAHVAIEAFAWRWLRGWTGVGELRMISLRNDGDYLICDVFVDPRYRGQGLGTKLLRTGIEAVRGRGGIRVVGNLSSVDDVTRLDGTAGKASTLSMRQIPASRRQSRCL